MSGHPILLGIVGDSAAGKTTLTRGIAQILGPENVTIICTDDYHRYDRRQRAEKGITALHPDCNYLDIIQQHLALLRTGQPILKPIYNHTTGAFDPPEYIEPRRYVIVEGLLGFTTRGMRDCYDVKVYLAPPESLRTRWKIKRDTAKRGYAEEAVLTEMRKREPDSEQYIRPQRGWADLVVSFYPSEQEVEDSQLNVRLVLRPTIPHPDFLEVITRSAAHHKSPVRMELDRDMGKPVDVLEVDGHTTDEQVRDLQEVLCGEGPYDAATCMTFDIGKLVGTTGEILQSHPLAISQLLITYHMLKASKGY
jgi:phosphoribulokinase